MCVLYRLAATNASISGIIGQLVDLVIMTSYIAERSTSSMCRTMRYPQSVKTALPKGLIPGTDG